MEEHDCSVSMDSFGHAISLRGKTQVLAVNCKALTNLPPSGICALLPCSSDCVLTFLFITTTPASSASLLFLAYVRCSPATEPVTCCSCCQNTLPWTCNALLPHVYHIVIQNLYFSTCPFLVACVSLTWHYPTYIINVVFT